MADKYEGVRRTSPDAIAGDTQAVGVATFSKSSAMLGAAVGDRPAAGKRTAQAQETQHQTPQDHDHETAKTRNDAGLGAGRRMHEHQRQLRTARSERAGSQNNPHGV